MKDEVLLKEVTADGERLDISDKGLPKSNCGFCYKFTEDDKKMPGRVRVLPSGSNLELPVGFTMPNQIVTGVSQLDKIEKKRCSSYSDMLILNHIPKTAGTSLRKALQEIYSGRDCLLHYNNLSKSSKIIWDWKFAENITVTFRNVAAHILTNQTALLAGHFGHPELYGFKDFVEAFPSCPSVVFFRSPQKHIYSLHQYDCRVAGCKDTFEEFIERPHTVNYQSNHMCGVSLDDITVVGIVERFSESLELLSACVGRKVKFRRDNVGKHNSWDPLKVASPTVWKRFQELNVDDYELYERASERLEKDLSK